MAPDPMRAWAAGFFDGEGSVYLRRSAGKLPAATLVLPQISRELLDKFNTITGGRGVVYADSSGRETPIHRLNVNGYPRVLEALRVMWPWLGQIKRDQARRAMVGHLEARSG